MKWLFLISIVVLLSCSPKEPKLEISSFTIADSIRIKDPDHDPSNGWLGASDTVISWDSIRIDVTVRYEGATLSYLDEIVWVLKSQADSTIKSFSALIYPPIYMEDGQQRNIYFYLYFDNKSAHIVDSIYDDSLNYYGVGKIDLYLCGTTYEQFIKSGKVSFNLRFVP